VTQSEARQRRLWIYAACKASFSGAQSIPKRTLIDIDELSTQLKIAKGTLYNWVYLRRILFVKLGRALRFDPVEIARVLEGSSTLEEVGTR
jgi:hypothetical protein